jgi:biotin-dependent carboxylase-like uncharacterized protein
VPLSGAMDQQALRIGNLLCGNGGRAASVEITAGGLRAEFLCDAHFAVTGADAAVLLNRDAVSLWQAHRGREGDVLTVAWAASGLRAYLAVSGGIDVPTVLESRSTYLRGGFGGHEGRALATGDVLSLGREIGKAKATPAPEELIPPYSGAPLLRVVMGPQDGRAAPEGRAAFLSGEYMVTARSDRMGSLLSGPTIALTAGADIISDGTCPGAVQVHGNGQPTILGADCQTTGGYVKIATVASADLPLAAQIVPGAWVRFREISLIDARELYLGNEYQMRKLL